MSKTTAKFILHKHGLSGFNIRELADLLKDHGFPLPDEVRRAILVLKTQN